MMTYEEVQGHLADILSKIYVYDDPYYEREIDKKKPTEILMARKTGGASGGNCWGDEAEHYEISDDEYKHDILLMLIERICPNITLVQYKKVEALARDGWYSVYEYYGNYTDYAVKIYNLQKVYDTLVSTKAI